MSYVDRPRDDGAALNIDGSHRADYLTVTTVTTLKVIVIVCEAYRLRLVALMMGEMERKRKGGEKVLQVKLQHLVPIIELHLK